MQLAQHCNAAVRQLRAWIRRLLRLKPATFFCETGSSGWLPEKIANAAFADNWPTWFEPNLAAVYPSPRATRDDMRSPECENGQSAKSSEQATTRSQGAGIVSCSESGS